MSAGIRAAWMRGGTSKGLVLLAEDVPADIESRDELLLRIMGSPDARQIDGIGGATSLTSKAAIVSPSALPGVDIDYLFLQVGVGTATVGTDQTCGNLLAAVGPFAVDRGLVTVPRDATHAEVTIRQMNSQEVAASRFPVADGQPVYDGDAAIAGVPNTAAPVELTFTPPPSAVFPTGVVREVIDGLDVTCVDAGMPVVVVAASALGLTGYEDPAALRADSALCDRIDRVRVEAGQRAGLGDVSPMTVPKTVAVAPARDGGTLAVRSFIPVNPHEALGVVTAISTAAAVATPGAVGHALTCGKRTGTVDFEHPAGHLLVDIDVAVGDGAPASVRVESATIIRTARLLFDGLVHPGPRSTAQKE